MQRNLSACILHYEVLNCQDENKVTCMKLTEYEESFNNYYSLVNYGAFIVPDVLKLNVISGMFFQVVTWSLAQMPKLATTESIVWLLDL